MPVNKNLINSNKDEDVAQELLQLLVERLPEDFAAIKQFKNEDNFSDLLKSVHKLHGAVAYCGVPRLKNALYSLENALKNNKKDEIADLFSIAEKEVQNVLRGD